MTTKIDINYLGIGDWLEYTDREGVTHAVEILQKDRSVFLAETVVRGVTTIKGERQFVEVWDTGAAFIMSDFEVQVAGLVDVLNKGEIP